jgi:predicted PurR-regulated permease PerM
LDSPSANRSEPVAESPSGASGTQPYGSSAVGRSRLRTDLRSLERIATGILVLLMLGVCYIAQDILVPLVLALLLSLLLTPLVNVAENLFRLPRALGSLLVIAMVIGALVLGVMQLAQPAQKWIATAPATMLALQQRLLSFQEPIRQAQEAGRSIDELTRSSEPTTTTTVVAAQSGVLDSVAGRTPRVLGTMAAVLLLVYFFLSSGDRFLRRMVEISPRLTDKKFVVSIARAVQEKVSHYLLTVSLINLALGAATALALLVMGVPNPLLWGVVAFLLNFVPYVGPLCTLLLLSLAGFSAFETLGHAVAVPAVFFVLTAVEGQLVTPMILGRRLALDPTVVFVWLMLWGWLWGGIGILLAGPLLACFSIICQHSPALQSFGILISDGRMSAGAGKERDDEPELPSGDAADAGATASRLRDKAAP